jgi:hypothetical protein
MIIDGHHRHHLIAEMPDTFKFLSACAILFAITIVGAIAAFLSPSKWERAGWGEAVVLRICPGNVPIVRLPNGEIWIRLTWSTRYRVEDEQTVCAPPLAGL